MKRIFVRFYASLNDLHPQDRRQINFIHHFIDEASIKDMIESLGVPHTEIELILVNGEPTDFSYLLQDNDRISVYPHFATIDISSISLVKPEPLEDIGFI